MSIFQFDGEQITARIPHPAGPFASARVCRVPERFRAGVALHMARLALPKTPAPAKASAPIVSPVRKRYEDLAGREKVALKASAPAEFARLRADALKRGVI